MRRCARCTFVMTPIDHQGAHVDHCRRCGGVFLERGETAVTLSDAADPEAWVRSRIATPLGPMKMRCPKDQSLFVGYRVTFGGASVEVDVCSTCRGLWLDNYEGPKLRYIAEEARRAATGQSNLAELARQIPRPETAQARVDPTPDLQTPGVASYFFQVFTGLPIEVYNPVKRKPVVIYSLVAFLSAVFVLQYLAASVAGEEGLRGFNDGLWLIPTEVLAGKNLWTVLTSTMLHGGLLHLLGNLYFLWIFGDNVEDKLGSFRVTVLYVLAGLLASGLHVAFNASSSIPTLGASGAVAGLMGAYLSLFPKTQVWLVLFFIRFKLSVYWYLGFWIAYQFLMAWMGAGGVAWYAHIGGFFAGIAFAPLFRKK